MIHHEYCLFNKMKYYIITEQWKKCIISFPTLLTHKSQPFKMNKLLFTLITLTTLLGASLGRPGESRVTTFLNIYITNLYCYSRAKRQLWTYISKYVYLKKWQKYFEVSIFFTTFAQMFVILTIENHFGPNSAIQAGISFRKN